MRCVETNVAMAIEDTINNVYGFQFHPDSFLTVDGKFLIQKKSYRLSNFKTTYDHLWGSTGVFTTIRLFGKEPKFVLLDEHIFKLNKSLKKLHIPFLLTRNIAF